MYGTESPRVFGNDTSSALNRAEAAAKSLPLGSAARVMAKRSADTRHCLEDIFYTITAQETPYVQMGAAVPLRNAPSILESVRNVCSKEGCVLSSGFHCEFNAMEVSLPEALLGSCKTPEAVAQYIREHGFEGMENVVAEGSRPPEMWVDLPGCTGSNLFDVEMGTQKVLDSVHRSLMIRSRVQRQMITELEFWHRQVAGRVSPQTGDCFAVDCRVARSAELAWHPGANTVQRETLAYMGSDKGCLDAGNPMNSARVILVVRPDCEDTKRGLLVRVHPKPPPATGDAMVLSRFDVQGAEDSPVRLHAVPKSDATLMNLWYSASLALQAERSLHGAERVALKRVDVEYALRAGDWKEMDVYSIRALLGGGEQDDVSVHITMAVVDTGVPQTLSPVPEDVMLVKNIRMEAHSFEPLTKRRNTALKSNKDTNTPLNSNKWNEFYQSVSLLESLAGSSVLLKKYIAKGGILTPTAFKSNDPWGRAVVCMMQNDREGSLQHLETICSQISQARAVMDGLKQRSSGGSGNVAALLARYAAASEKLDALVADKTQSASVIRAICTRYLE